MTGPAAAVATQVRSVATIVHDRGVSAAVVQQQAPVATVAAHQGPAGPPGANAAAPKVYAITAAASFAAAHGLPFAPEVWIVTPEGEVVETDLHHGLGVVTAIFPLPFTGTLYLR